MAERLRDLTDDYMEACRTISEMDHYDADADEEEQIKDRERDGSEG